MAQLASVSVTWYTWLEQARDIGVSRQVIDSLARALRMDPAERSHLFTLAGLAVPADDYPRRAVDDTLRRLLDTLQPNPAYVVNPWWDLLAYNDAYAELVGGLHHRTPAEQNIVWLTFTDTSLRNLLVDWPTQARQLVGQLRRNLGEHPHDPRGPELVHALEAASPHFAELWGDHDVRGFESARKRFDHPDAGRLELDYIKLATASDSHQHVIVFLPANPTCAARLANFRKRAS